MGASMGCDRNLGCTRCSRTLDEASAVLEKSPCLTSPFWQEVSEAAEALVPEDPQTKAYTTHRAQASAAAAELCALLNADTHNYCEEWQTLRAELSKYSNLWASLGSQYSQGPVVLLKRKVELTLSVDMRTDPMPALEELLHANEAVEEMIRCLDAQNKQKLRWLEDARAKLEFAAWAVRTRRSAPVLSPSTQRLVEGALQRLQVRKAREAVVGYLGLVMEADDSRFESPRALLHAASKGCHLTDRGLKETLHEVLTADDAYRQLFQMEPPSAACMRSLGDGLKPGPPTSSQYLAFKGSPKKKTPV